MQEIIRGFDDEELQLLSKRARTPQEAWLKAVALATLKLPVILDTGKQLTKAGVALKHEESIGSSISVDEAPTPPPTPPRSRMIRESSSAPLKKKATKKKAVKHGK